jgi:hypothetical protein
MTDLDARLSAVPDPFARVLEGEPLPALRRPSFPSPSRSSRRRTGVAAIAAAGIYEIAGFAFFHARRNLETTSAPLLALEVALPLAVAAFALRAAIQKGPLGLGGGPAKITVSTAAALLLFVVATLSAFPPDAHDGAFWAQAGACMLVTSILGVGPLALAGWALRSTFAAAARWRTAAVGVAAGSLAAATIAFVCPVNSALHVLVGHGAMVLGLGLVAWAVVDRATRI